MDILSKNGKTQIPKNSKKGPPKVKQTLTSKYRMLKVNPLLMYELGKKLGPNYGSNESFVIKPPLKILAAALDADTQVPTFNISRHKPVQAAPLNNNKCSSVSIREKQRITSAREPTKHKHLQRLDAASQKIKQSTDVQNVYYKETSQTIKTTKNVKNTVDITKRSSDLVPLSDRTDTANNSGKKRMCLMNSNSGEMTRRLSEWLKGKGKNSGDYHHLKRFGIHAQTKAQGTCVEEKENFVSETLRENENLETENVGLFTVAQAALMDLHKLILEGYPSQHCEVWLKLIKEKYKQVEQEQQYWECRAALEQTKDINLAVECYKAAIMRGNEVHCSLLNKFTLLNIDSEVNYKERCKFAEDTKNIFKSSTIQFAVQEKCFKKKNEEGVVTEKKIVATPVKRSTRLSRSAYVSTPGVRVYSSLQEVDGAARKSLNFKCNNALKDQF